MKPLEDPSPEDLTTYANPIGRLVDLPTTAGYPDTVEFFTGYPERSLASAQSRAFLYQAVKAIKAGFVLEIGSYYAGTTEVLARAIHANGSGHVMTIDPYGGKRVPEILEAWPPELRDVTTYAAIDSMGLFSEFAHVRPSIDLVFVDGNHDYGYALFDLTMSAKWVRPGGIIVLDDVPEPSVYTAAQDFLRINTGWRALGGLRDGLDLSDPFHSMDRATLGEVGFTVLTAPPHIEIRDKAVSFSYGQFPEPGIAGFRIDVLDGAAGRLHAKVVLRSFYEDARRGDPLTVPARLSSDIAGGGGKLDIVLDTPSMTTHDVDGSWREIELVLVWEDLGGENALRLSARPEVKMIPTDSAANA